MRTETNYYTTYKEYLVAVNFYKIVTSIYKKGVVRDGMLKGAWFIQFKKRK